MDVFLVPVGPDAYELYCEHVDAPDAHDGEPSAGFVARLRHRFHQVLSEAERDRRQGTAASSDGGWLQRVKRRSMRWVAESIAEQRLLWNLRRHETASLLYPDDMPAHSAVEIMRRQLARDFDKHRFWLAIDSVLMVAAGLLFWLPGPNVLGYYFAFRVVGHYFSVRGARRGLKDVTWSPEASPSLTELRRALTLDPAGRLRQAEEIALRLRLVHLATFFQRTAVP